MQVSEYITKDIYRGIAVIEGTNTSVATVIFLKEQGNTLEEITSAFKITRKQAKAANEYYKNNKEEVEKDMRKMSFQ